MSIVVGENSVETRTHIPIPVIADSIPTERQDVVRSKLARRLVGGVLSLAVVSGVIDVTPVLHKDASMISDLAVSDLSSKPSIPQNEAANIVNNYSLGDNLFKGNSIGWIASAWFSSQALNAEYLTSLDNGVSRRYSRHFKASLNAINSSYIGEVPSRKLGNHHPTGKMLRCYEQGPTNFHVSSDAPLIDDNNWMGLIDFREYLRTKTPLLLKDTEAVFNLAHSQWDPNGGGIYWQYQLDNNVSHGRALVSNAPVVILGVELYKATGKESYLKFAEKVYSWVQHNLYDPGTGLYNDHIGRNNVIDYAKYTYGQAVMFEAMSKLNEVNPSKYPLSNAISLAERSMAYFGQNNGYGNPAFDSIYDQGLMDLAYRYHNASFTNKVISTVRETNMKSPANPKSLLNVAGKAAIQALVKLPQNKYNQLF